MSLVYNSLSHSKWGCKYHIIFIPKMRKNRLYGDIRPRLGQIFHALAAQKDVKIVEGLCTCWLKYHQRIKPQKWWAS